MNVFFNPLRFNTGLHQKIFTEVFTYSFILSPTVKLVLVLQMTDFFLGGKKGAFFFPSYGVKFYVSMFYFLLGNAQLGKNVHSGRKV